MMSRKSNSIPSWVIDALPPVPGGQRPMKILASAELKNGQWAVATVTTLLVISQGGIEVDFDWDIVDTASWENEEDTITVEWVTGQEPLTLPLASDKDARFATTLRERIQASVVMSETVDISPGVTAKVALRRTATGKITSQVMGGPDLDLDNPKIAQIVNDAEARLREHAGLPS